MRHRVVRNRWTLAGLALVTLLGLAALAAPWLAPGDPTRGALTAALRSPSTTYLLGTDAQGRDVLSRVLFGARLSLAVGLASQVIALAAGLTLGLTAGFYGRWVDAVVMRAPDVTLAFPSLLLLIAVAPGVRASAPGGCVVIGLVGSAGASHRGCPSSPGSRSVSRCWPSISWATVCATRSTSEHDRHRLPSDSAACPARSVPRAARRGVPVDRGHRIPEQRFHRSHPRAHAPRPGRIHGETDRSPPPPGPRAPGGTAGGPIGRSATHQRGPERDRARHQHQPRPEPRRSGAAVAAGRRRPHIGPRIPGERVSLDAAQETRHRSRARPLRPRRLARRGLPRRAVARPAGACPRGVLRPVLQRLSRRSRSVGRGLPCQRHVPRRRRDSGGGELGARRARDAGGHPGVRRAEVAARALGIWVRVRAAGAHPRARARGYRLDGVRGDRRPRAPSLGKPPVPPRTPA